MKKINLFILIILIGFTFVFSSCKEDKDNKLITNLVTFGDVLENNGQYIVQMDYYTYPSDIEDINIKWSVNNTYKTSIDENGLFTTDLVEGTFIITCLETNSNLSYDYTLTLIRDEEYDTLWQNNRSYNYITNLDDENLKKFTDKYNNSFIYSYDVIEIIKEKEKDNIEFLEVINELEKSYFNESNLENKMYVLCKLTSEEYDILRCLDVYRIDIKDNKLTLKFKELFEVEPTYTELYYLLEIEKTDYSDVMDYTYPNSKVFYINYKIDFNDFDPWDNNKIDD